MALRPAGAAPAPRPAPAPTPIAGFGQRIFAFLADIIILALVGFCIGLFFYDRLVALGSLARIVGFAISLFYFGVMDSSAGGGASLGKRLFGLRVVGRNGETVSLPRAFLRSIIYLVPFYLNGVDLAFLKLGTEGLAIALAADAVIVFGFIGAIVYLYIANRATRQSLHDLAAGTFVIRAPALHAPILAQNRRVHMVVAACWFLVLFAGVTVAANYLDMPVLSNFFGVNFAEMGKIQQAINADPGIRATRIATNKSTTITPSGKTTRTSLIVTVELTGATDTPERVANSVAAHVLDLSPGILGDQKLVIVVLYGYDLGLASSWRSFEYSETPAAWQAKFRAQQPGRAT